MAKKFTINLDYGISEADRTDSKTGEVVTFSQFTQIFVQYAFNSNHSTQNPENYEVGRTLRAILKAIEEAVEKGSPEVELGDSEFDTLLEELTTCKWPMPHLVNVPILIAEMKRVK